jgi:hypothetical protein
MKAGSKIKKRIPEAFTNKFKLHLLAVAFAFALTILLSFWMTGRATQPDQEFLPQQQPSPLETVSTETPDPFAAPVETSEPFIAPTETPADILPDSVAPEETATPTETPTPSAMAPQIQQPIALPTLIPPPDPLSYVGSVITGMGNVAAWLWLLCGSLIFFVVAGLVGGLYFSRQERHRYDLYVLEPDESPDLELTKPTPDDDSDSIWPASLP